MGGKKRDNPKAVEARARKEAALAEKKAIAKKQAEDAAWTDDGKDKRSLRRAAEEQKKLELAKRKKEKKELEEKERLELDKKKVQRVSVKLTQAQIQAKRDAREQERQAKLREAENKKKNIVQQIPLEENLNSQIGNEEWTADINKAVDNLKSGGEATDLHPERRRKAQYNAYFDANLPLKKLEYPHLKLSQYKEMIFREWQKAPENPINQEAS